LCFELFPPINSKLIFRMKRGLQDSETTQTES
jgi:hypothetical protein